MNGGAEEAAAGDARGALTDRTIAALRNDDFFALVLPKCFGGVEANPVAALRVFEELSRADGSTGWVVGLAMATLGTFMSLLPEAGVGKVFDSPNFMMAGLGEKGAGGAVNSRPSTSR